MYIIVEHYKLVLLKENLMKTRAQRAKNLVYTLQYPLKIMHRFDLPFLQVMKLPAGHSILTVVHQRTYYGQNTHGRATLNH